MGRFFLFICLSGGLKDRFFGVFFPPNPKEGIPDVLARGPIIPVFTVPDTFHSALLFYGFLRIPVSPNSLLDIVEFSENPASGYDSRLVAMGKHQQLQKWMLDLLEVGTPGKYFRGKKTPFQ